MVLGSQDCWVIIVVLDKTIWKLSYTALVTGTILIVKLNYWFIVEFDRDADNDRGKADCIANRVVKR